MGPTAGADRAIGDLGLCHAVVMGLAQSACAYARGIAVGHHDHRRSLHGARSRQRRPLLLLSPASDRHRRRLLKGVRDVVLGELPDGWDGPFVVGTLAALGSGLLAIEWLLGYVRGHTYRVFVVYRVVVAGLVLIAIVSGVRDATF